MAPGIPVGDIHRSVNFYVGLLGMNVTFENGNPVGFVILEREGCELHLTLARSLGPRTFNAAHLMVSDATRLHDHLVANGVRIIKGLRDADYGLRGFVFEDPDANRIDVGEEL
jgi:catechol 2,3-dioxygenase-like lactoylglutathione lyase family enzyme